MSGYPAVVAIHSRECSADMLERLAGSTLFPERPVGASVVSVVRRRGGSLLYVTAPAMIDAAEQVEYFLRLLPEEYEGQLKDARDRVAIGSLDDDSARWLSTKVLDPDNPTAAELRARIRDFVGRQRAAGASAQLSYFEPSDNLQRMAGELGVPGDQAAAAAIPLGTKFAGRELLAEAGVPLAAGTPEARSLRALADGLADLVEAGHRSFALKLNSTEFGGGMGNARLDLSGLAYDGREDLIAAISAALPNAALVDPNLTWDQYAAMIPASGIIAEEWIGGAELRSPSFQGHIAADGTVTPVSTHDQILGGPAGMTYVGSAFPADAGYRPAIVKYGLAVGWKLAARNVRGGDYGIDFLVVREGTDWKVLGCELNLRSTGTKHGFVMVTSLLDTQPDADGILHADGEERVYQASDSIADPSLVGLSPAQLIAAVSSSPLHYDPVAKAGVVLHMLSAVTAYGKFGAVCIARSRDEAAQMMQGLSELVRGIAIFDQPLPPSAREFQASGGRRGVADSLVSPQRRP